MRLQLFSFKLRRAGLYLYRQSACCQRYFLTDDCNHSNCLGYGRSYFTHCSDFDDRYGKLRSRNLGICGYDDCGNRCRLHLVGRCSVHRQCGQTFTYTLSPAVASGSTNVNNASSAEIELDNGATFVSNPSNSSWSCKLNTSVPISSCISLASLPILPGSGRLP